MAITFSTQLSETILENRWSSEFFNPNYSLPQTPTIVWNRIGNQLSFYQYGISIKMNELGNGTPIYRLNEIDECFIKSKPVKYAKISSSERKQFSLKKDDILFCRTNGNINFVGRTGIVKEDLEAVFASYLVRVRTITDKLLPEFLTIYLNSKIGKKQILRRAMPSNQVNVSAAELRRVFVPSIDLTFQNDIAHKVNNSYSLRKQSEHLFSSAVSILQKELGLDKVIFNSKNFQTKFNSAINFNRFDAEYFQPKYNQIKELIKNYKFGYESFPQNIISLSPNINPRAKPAEVFDYIELSNVKGSLGIVEGSTRLYGKNTPSRAQRQVKTGDVIASSVVGSVDKSAIISKNENDFLASTGFFHLRSHHYSSEYLLLLIQNQILTEQLKQEATGGILSAVPNDKLKFIIIPKIPIEFQNELSSLVKKSHFAYEESRQILFSAIKQVEDLIATEAAKNN